MEATMPDQGSLSFTGGFSTRPGEEGRPLAAGLDHEWLDVVYRGSSGLSRGVARMVRQVGGLRPNLADQLERATAPIPVNTAEANGEPTCRHRAYFLRVARASATEVAPALDPMVDIGLPDRADIRTGKAPVVRTVPVLVRPMV